MKEVCIINYTSNAAVYGIGTYIKECIYCLANLDCKINRIELGTDSVKAEFYVKEEGKVRTIHLPYHLKGDKDSYYKGIFWLLRFYIEDSENLVFLLQYGHDESLLNEIKKHFPQSKTVFTVHYMNWSPALQGNVTLFEKIIRNKEKEKIKNRYRQVIENHNVEKTFLEKSDHIVCLTDDTLDIIQKMYDIKENIWLIPNGLRKNFRNLSVNQKLKLREKFYIGPDEKVLLSVARIDPFKGVDCLLSCFDDIIKNYPNCRLVIIGDGDTNAVIKKCKKSWSKVIFTGKLDKKTLYRWYQIADIALFPSFFEQCSYVGIEMLMHGLPVIASDGIGVRNMFHDGINAKIARIENWKNKSKFVKNLKEAVLHLLNSSLSELKIRKGAVKSYKTKYSIELMQENYCKLLNSL